MTPPTRVDWIIVGSVVLALNLAAFFFLPLSCVNIWVYCLFALTILFGVLALVLFGLAAWRRRFR